MKKILTVIIAAIALLTACDDTTDTLGSSLTKNEDLITVTDGIFKVQSRSVVVDSVLSKNVTGYLGKVKDPETGTYISSNLLTQFHVFEKYTLPKTNMLARGIVADSCRVTLYLSSFYGDSLASMKASLYELEKPIEENQNYYSSFNPEKEGYLRLADEAVKVSKVYTIANGNYTDSLRNAGNYVNNITFSLNAPYTDRQGKKYNNYGTYVMQKYYDDPDNYKNSYNFIHDVCPGFYIKTDNGVGSMAYIYNTQLNVYFTIKDSVEHAAMANFSGTEEVRQITEIYNDKARIQQLAADNTCTYVKSPAGIFTELTLPVEDICDGHENDSINSAKIVLHCLTDNIQSQYAFSAPATLLMVRAAEAKKFFEDNKVANNRTSYVSKYESTGNSYTFTNIGELIKSMFAKLPKEEAMRKAWKQSNPDWNKVLLIPVSTSYMTYSSSNILSRVANDMSLSSVRLVGGTQNPNGDITISVIYSKFAE